MRIERRLRGREDFEKLARADCVVVSFGKSGRTWLRVMLSRFYQVRYGLARRHLLSFDNLHNKNSAIPKIFFTHDNYLKDYADAGRPESAVSRQEGRADDSRPGGCCRVPVLPMEIPDAEPEKANKRLSIAGRRCFSLRLRHAAAIRAAQGHRVHERLGPGAGPHQGSAGRALRGPARRSRGRADAHPAISSARPAARKTCAKR